MSQNIDNISIAGNKITGSPEVDTLNVTEGLLFAGESGIAGQVIVSGGVGNPPTWGSGGAGSFDDLSGQLDPSTQIADDTIPVSKLQGTGDANGLATLDGTGKVPSSQLPSYVDDVLEYANLAAFPGTGISGIIYVALDSNRVYRWSGSAYVEISSGVALTDRDYGDIVVSGSGLVMTIENGAVTESKLSTTGIAATSTFLRGDMEWAAIGQLIYGTNAPTSGTGNNGDFYIATSTNYIYGPKASGTWPVGVSLVGPQGATGATGSTGTAGNTVLSGASAPTTQGVDGDFYLETTNYRMYGPKSGGVWSGVYTSLVGPQGTTGATGATGQGVPTGGSAGQVLAKIDATDYNTEWVNQNAASTVVALTDRYQELPWQVYTEFAHAGQRDIQVAIDAHVGGAAAQVVVGPGTYSGSTVLINDKANFALIGPDGGDFGGTITTLGASRGLTVGGTTIRARVANLQIEGLTTISTSGAGAHRFDNCQLLGGLTVTTSNPYGTIIYITNSYLSGTLTIPLGYQGLIIIDRCQIQSFTIANSGVAGNLQMSNIGGWTAFPTSGVTLVAGHQLATGTYRYYTNGAQINFTDLAGTVNSTTQISNTSIGVGKINATGTPSSSTFLRGDGSWAAGTGITDGDKGDVTVSASGATWTIDNQAVTYAKIQNVSATDKLLGRASAGAGSIEEITLTAAGRALLDDVDAAAQRATLGLGTISGTNTGDQNVFSTIAVADQDSLVADTGTDTLTLVAGSNITITTNASADSITIASTAGGVGVTDGDKGDITVSSSGATWTIDNQAVTYAKIQDISSTDKLLGRASIGAGSIEEITLTAAGRALLDDVDAAAQRATLGLGTLATQSGTFSGTNTGDQNIFSTIAVAGQDSLIADTTSDTLTLVQGSNVVLTTSAAGDSVTISANAMNTLLNGSGAPSSGLGNDGDFYLDTTADAIYGPKAAGAWGSPTSIIGATGPTGSSGADGLDGKTILSGSTNPTTQGVDGDFYLNTATSTLFGPKASGTWPSGVSLIGPQGPQGVPGQFGGACFRYKYLVTQTGSDPGSGNLKFNNTLTTATILYIDPIDFNSGDLTAFLEEIDASTSDIKGFIKIDTYGDAANYLFYKITGAHLSTTGFFAVPIAYLGGNVTTWPNEQDVQITFLRTGDKGNTGAGGVLGNYGSFSDTTIQTNSGVNAANVMTFNTTEEQNGVSIVAGSRITMANQGTYNVQFSAQIDKTDSNDDTIEIWFRLNGSDVPRSNTNLLISGNNAKYVAAWNFVITVDAGDYVEIAWASPDIDMRLTYSAETTVPLRPAIPSVILTVSQVMYTQVGPQGPVGPQGDPGGPLANGDYGDITVSGDGTVFTIDSGLSAEKIADGSVSNTEFQYLNGVTSAIQTQLTGKVTANSSITGATKTKITYDSKGLVTSGADATTADIADSLNKRYITDAQQTVLGNTSGTNTGDQLVFKTVAVSGQDNVVAGTTTDTLNLSAGTGIAITTNASTDTITIATTSNVSGQNLTKTITQSSHGFVVGDVLRYNGTAYVKSQADTSANSEVYGIVSAVTDIDNFVLTLSGEITGLTSLTAGEVYFLSPTTEGMLTSTAPSLAGQIVKPLLFTTSTTSGYFVNMRGEEITSLSLNSFSTISVASQDDVVADSGTDTLNLAAGSGIEITTNAGTDTITITATGGGGGSGQNLTKSITQSSHGLVVGDVVRLSGVNYITAQADTEANAEVVGIVSDVASDSQFTLTISGEVTGLTGLTAGEVYFLSASSAGDITTTAPSTTGQVVKPLFIATSTTAGYFYNMRGVTVAAPSSLSTFSTISVVAQDDVVAESNSDTLFLAAGSGIEITTSASTDTITIAATGGGASGQNLTKTISDSEHVLSVGNVVRFNGTNYVKAQADSAANAEVVGIVSATTGTGFTITLAGEVTGLSGLTAGEAYFLSPSSAGTITTTAPSAAGQVIKPLFIATSTTSGYFFNMRGELITSSATSSASYVEYNTPTFGSTNTYVIRWNNNIKTVGTDITYVDSPTLGGSFKINTAGRYIVFLQMRTGSSFSYYGIKKATAINNNFNYDANDWVGAINGNNFWSTQSTIDCAVDDLIFFLSMSGVSNNVSSRMSILGPF